MKVTTVFVGKHQNMQPNHSVSRIIEKSWEMIEKDRLYLAKNAPQDNRQHISRSSTTVGKSKPTGHMQPQLKKRRTDAEGMSASSNSNREFVRSEDVKAEIQSLVKHSLSAMHKDKNKLGTYIFLQFIFSFY